MCGWLGGWVGWEGGAHGSRIEDPNADRHLEDGFSDNLKLEPFGKHQELKKPRIRGLPGIQQK